MEQKARKSDPSVLMEEKLKKAVTEMLVLQLLDEREMYPGEITSELRRRSGGVCGIGFPYSILYRMTDFGYLYECLPKRIAPDGRRRQYYGISDAGKQYLEELVISYRKFTGGVESLLHFSENQEGDT